MKLTIKAEPKSKEELIELLEECKRRVIDSNDFINKNYSEITLGKCEKGEPGWYTIHIDKREEYRICKAKELISDSNIPTLYKNALKRAGFQFWNQLYEEYQRKGRFFIRCIGEKGEQVIKHELKKKGYNL